MLFLLYQLLFPLMAIGILCKLLLDGRARILRETGGQIRQRLGLLSKEDLAGLRASDEPVIWVHAASIGEVNAAALLFEAMRTSAQAPRILLTTSTVTGQRHATSLAIPPDLAVLAPADFHPCVAAFLRRTRPYALVVMETEL